MNAYGTQSLHLTSAPHLPPQVASRRGRSRRHAPSCASYRHRADCGRWGPLHTDARPSCCSGGSPSIGRSFALNPHSPSTSTPTSRARGSGHRGRRALPLRPPPQAPAVGVAQRYCRQHKEGLPPPRLAIQRPHTIYNTRIMRPGGVPIRSVDVKPRRSWRAPPPCVCLPAQRPAPRLCPYRVSLSACRRLRSCSSASSRVIAPHSDTPAASACAMPFPF
jgi:hypothetical protein